MLSRCDRVEQMLNQGCPSSRRIAYRIMPLSANVHKRMGCTATQGDWYHS